tara:strand:+ start:3115 stop:3546 length:432 start_codon:yes stop_codon:yes gene_type:complete
MKKINNILSKKINFSRLEHPTIRIPKTFGQKAADLLTRWAGSWTFIISLAMLLFVWILINTLWLLFGKTWDPYPFILLNFVLSTLAAVQAPIILMSQNRQGQKDHLQAQYDYAVNKKAEKEIQQVKRQLNRIEESIMRKLKER